MQFQFHSKQLKFQYQTITILIPHRTDSDIPILLLSNGPTFLLELESASAVNSNFEIVPGLINDLSSIVALGMSKIG